MRLATRSYEAYAMGTKVKLLVVTNDEEAGEEALQRAVRDLEETKQALSRFCEDSDLAVLNRRGRFRCGTPDDEGRPPGRPPACWRLLAAVGAAADAYEWSKGLLDPRVLGVPLSLIAVCFVWGGVLGTVSVGALEYDVVRALGFLPNLGIGLIEEGAKLIIPLALYFVGRYRSGADGVHNGLDHIRRV